MDIHQIRCFKRVAELRSFTAAAKHLNITQPALSRQVQGLEDELGTQLLLRTTRGVQPTAAGKVMMEMGGNLLDYMEGIRKAWPVPHTTLPAKSSSACRHRSRAVWRRA